MTAWEAHILGAEWAPKWSRWCATTRAPGALAQQYAAVLVEGWGPHSWPRPTRIRRAGPVHPWDAAAGGWLLAALGPHVGWSEDVPSLIRAPLPPRLVLHAANLLQATGIHTWGCDRAIIWWLPPESGATRLTVEHSKDGGPTYDDAMSRLGDIPGPLLLMLPTDLAAALRREMNGCDGL